MKYKPITFGLEKTGANTYEGSPCDGVKAKLVKIETDHWHIYIRNDNPGIKFPIIGTVTKSRDDALEFLDNYEGC